MYIVYILYNCQTSRGRLSSGVFMGYIIKVQKVERPTNRSFYLNLPTVLAEALDIQKGEQLQWIIEDKNTLILSRLNAQKPRRLKHKP